MVPVSRRHVVISLPDARPMWQYRFHVPNVFDGKHCWVIKKQGYDLARSSNLGRLPTGQELPRVRKNLSPFFCV